MNNIKIDFKEGVNKKGNKYAYIVFKVNTPSGVYTSSPVFPSPLEMSILKATFAQSSQDNIQNTNNNSIGSIYSNSDTSLDAEF